MAAEAGYVAEELFQFWLDVNAIIGGWAIVFFLLRYRPWWWVAVLKTFGLAAVVVFQAVASLALLLDGLPADDILLYAAWFLLAVWLASKAACEGLAHALLVFWGRMSEVAVIHQRSAVFDRDGADGTPRVTVVKKVKREAVRR